jgi:hypothetical protein
LFKQNYLVDTAGREWFKIKIFYCYAREDKTLRDDLEMHLSSLKHQKQTTHWHDGEIHPGTEWQQEIEIHLKTAHIILEKDSKVMNV